MSVNQSRRMSDRARRTDVERGWLRTRGEDWGGKTDERREREKTIKEGQGEG